MADDRAAWYYNPSSRGMKALRFLNLLEDDLCKISITKAGLWSTTIQTICMALFSSSPAAVGMSAANSLAWLAGHHAAKQLRK
jgi:hypothetical protein